MCYSLELLCSQWHLQNKALTVQVFLVLYVFSPPSLSSGNDWMFVEKGRYSTVSHRHQGGLTSPLIDSISHPDWWLEGLSPTMFSKSMKILLRHFSLRSSYIHLPLLFPFHPEWNIQRLLAFSKMDRIVIHVKNQTTKLVPVSSVGESFIQIRTRINQPVHK